MFQKLRAFLHDRHLHNLEEALTYAIRKRAHAIGDREKERALRDHYENLSQRLDPKQDWWGYADAREKAVNHQTDLEQEMRMVELWDARVDARRLRLTQAQLGYRHPRPWHVRRRLWILHREHA